MVAEIPFCPVCYILTTYLQDITYVLKTYLQAKSGSFWFYLRHPLSPKLFLSSQPLQTCHLFSHKNSDVVRSPVFTIFSFPFLPVFNKKQVFTVSSSPWLEQKSTSPFSVCFPYESLLSVGDPAGFPWMANFSQLTICTVKGNCMWLVYFLKAWRNIHQPNSWILEWILLIEDNFGI